VPVEHLGHDALAVVVRADVAPVDRRAAVAMLVEESLGRVRGA
jgi:hypothetical protein